MHSTIERWLASALFAGLLLAGAILAQPPGPKEGLPKGTAPAADVGGKGITRADGLRVDDVVERIMAFDRNKDGKVTRDELPERMHHLIALGDSNKDGALDKDEIRKLATRQAATPEGFGGQIRRGPGPGPGGPGVFRAVGDIRFGPGPGPGARGGLGVGGSCRLLRRPCCHR
jgi:hypothetical protein